MPGVDVPNEGVQEQAIWSEDPPPSLSERIEDITLLVRDITSSLWERYTRDELDSHPDSL